MELACYDLRADAHHTITLEIARDTQSAQDAVDRELVARYRPGQPRAGLLVQVVERIHHLQDIAARSRHELPLPPMSAVAERVTFPGDIWPLADERWQALGYRSLSAYVTGLICLSVGRIPTQRGEVRSKVQRAITKKTVAARRRGGKRKILLDHIIERAKGRRMPKDELEKMKAQIAQTLRDILFTKKP